MLHSVVIVERDMLQVLWLRGILSPTRDSDYLGTYLGSWEGLEAARTSGQSTPYCNRIPSNTFLPTRSKGRRSSGAHIC